MALIFVPIDASVRPVSVQSSPSVATASKNSSDRRTELFAFWPETVWYASPLKS